MLSDIFDMPFYFAFIHSEKSHIVILYITYVCIWRKCTKVYLITKSREEKDMVKAAE